MPCSAGDRRPTPGRPPDSAPGPCVPDSAGPIGPGDAAAPGRFALRCPELTNDVARVEKPGENEAVLNRTDGDPADRDITVPDTAVPANAAPDNTEPDNREPVSIDPDNTDPGSTDPVDCKPVGCEPVGTDPDHTDPVDREPVGIDAPTDDPTTAGPGAPGPTAIGCAGSVGCQRRRSGTATDSGLRRTGAVPSERTIRDPIAGAAGC